MSTEVFVQHKLNTDPAFPGADTRMVTPETALPAPLRDRDFISNLYIEGSYQFDQNDFITWARGKLQEKRATLNAEAEIHPVGETLEDYEDFLYMMGDWLISQHDIIPKTWKDSTTMQKNITTAHNLGITLPANLILAGVIHPDNEIKKTAWLGFMDLPESGQDFVQTELQIMSPK